MTEVRTRRRRHSVLAFLLVAMPSALGLAACSSALGLADGGGPAVDATPGDGAPDRDAGGLDAAPGGDASMSPRDAAARVDAALVDAAADADADADAAPAEDAQPPDAAAPGPDAGGQSDGAAPMLTCAMQAPYQMNASGCGTERWSVKTAQDVDVGMVNLSPVPTTIGALVVLAPPSPLPGERRFAPVEVTTYRLENVTLTELKKESDSDYHLVLDDGLGHTMIAEVPVPECAMASSLLCLITHARHAADGLVGRSGVVVSLVGIGFFDYLHNQTGVAPNAIELHPVLGLCAGQDCDPTAD
jgi:hypothetical protein